jgi:hypothetical protein
MSKRVIIAITLMITLVLSGCSGGARKETQAMLDIRAHYLKADSVSLNAKLSADYGGRVYGYTLNYVGNGTRGELTVTEPAVINRLTAVIDGGKVQLKSDGAIIDTGDIAGKGVNPVAAFPLMIDAWKSGYITSAYGEKLAVTGVEPEQSIYCIVAEIQLTGRDVTLKTWFNPENYAPVRSEIYSVGYCVIIVDFITEPSLKD